LAGCETRSHGRKTGFGRICHDQARIVEECGASIGVGNIGHCLGHALERGVKVPAERILPRGVTAFHEIGENLRVV
jgi:hypothetical protein